MKGNAALGHKRAFAVQTGMSALPPKADMCGARAHVRFGPKADSCSAAKSIAIRSPRGEQRTSRDKLKPSGLAYVSFTFQKSGVLNLRTSRTFFRNAVG